MLQSLYRVLEVPTTASRTQIRDAYQRQLARVRAGELSSSLRPLIERACATLDDPSRRVSYDARLAELPRWERPPIPAPASSVRLQVPAIAATAATVAVALAVLFAALPSRGQHSASKPSVSKPIETIVSEVVTAPPVQPESPAIADESTPPEEAVSTAQSEPSETVAVRQPVQFATNRSAPALQSRAAIRPAEAVAASRPEPDVPVQAAMAAQPEVEAAAAVGASTPALVQSSPHGRVNANSNSRLDFRVQGWFCHDSSGGEIFISAGAPLPTGVNCY
ncbi:MAG TPA: hypothetical protein VK821_21245 [Dehalococcoidia bacterium]|nr:hypothetical protein [Dehalococcoidia bacterium]